MDVDCTHAVQLKGLCALCGADITSLSQITYRTRLASLLCSAIDSPIVEESIEASLHVLHDNPGLKVTLAEATRLERESTSRLLEKRKLSLVVDLDQTVLHAAVATPAMDGVVEGCPDVHRIVLADSLHSYHVKLRPHLDDFFSSLSPLFEMHIYTMGSRSYADAVVRLIDPTGSLFHDRVLTRDENEIVENRKELKRIFPCNDRMVVIIDDRSDVWTGCLNLLPIRPYVFFQGDVLDEQHDVIVRGSITANDLDDQLPKTLAILRQVHARFFELALDQADIKHILSTMKGRVFHGLHFAFSSCYPVNAKPRLQPIWKDAELWGAQCHDRITEAVTHLITARDDTDKVEEAIRRGIPVVSPQWLYASMAEWMRLPEALFEVRPPAAITLNPDDLAEIDRELEELSSSSSTTASSSGQEDAAEEVAPKRLRLSFDDSSQSQLSDCDSLVRELEGDFTA